MSPPPPLSIFPVLLDLYHFIIKLGVGGASGDVRLIHISMFIYSTDIVVVGRMRELGNKQRNTQTDKLTYILLLIVLLVLMLSFDS